MKQKVVVKRFGKYCLYRTYDDEISGLERIGILFVYLIISVILFALVAYTLNVPVAFFVAGFAARSIEINYD